LSIVPATLHVTLIACGLGLLLSGTVNAALHARGRGTRAAVLALSAVVALLVSGSPLAAALVAGSAAGGYTLLTRAADLLRHPWFRWYVVGAAGFGLAALGAALFPPAEAEAGPRTTLQQEADGTSPELADEGDAQARTDRGSPIRLVRPKDPVTSRRMRWLEGQVLGGLIQSGRLVRTGPADVRCNCHGWVFTGGRFWVMWEEVAQVLQENGYTPAAAAAAGDLVVYRDESGVINHTGVVRSAAGEGAVFVESKFCWQGLFVHRVEDTEYGQSYTFYHTERGGHRLAGLE
jgi:hypothetical protein